MADIERVWTPEEILAEVERLPPQTMPGSVHAYANTDSILLGRIVEAVTAALIRPSGPDTGYGRGGEAFETALAPAYGHQGSIPGYAALVLHSPNAISHWS